MADCPFSPHPPTGEDPFREARDSTGVLVTEFQGKPVPMILTHAGVKASARDWKTFSSDAPFQVPIPSEEKVRSMRQLPIETDPPDHGDYRKIAEPFFNRPKDPGMIAAVEKLISGLLHTCLRKKIVEVVHEFALPLQCRALALLLNVPEEEATEWIDWGIHVFREGDGEAKGSTLDRYIHRRLDQALNNPRDDFFTALTQARFHGRSLTREEQAGFVNLTFAGGRDTIIHSISGVIAHFGENAGDLDRLRKNPALIMPATEEFFRYLSPLTHIGRVCPVKTQIGNASVDPGGRVSLAWASANRDPAVFPQPNLFQIDRKPNQHLAFGSGPHTCLGALHARLLVRTLLRALSIQVGSITIEQQFPLWEQEKDYSRKNGFSSLHVRFHQFTGSNP